MRIIEPNQPEAEEFAGAESREERLLEENAKLRQQVRELTAHPAAAKAPRPTSAVVWLVAIGIAVLLAVAFFVGYMPRFKRDSLMRAESQEQAQALPKVNVTKVVRSSATSELVLSGNIQPVTESPVLARADGYIKKRLVDIGDRVKTGQPMAEIEAPELDHQVSQARAAVRQTQAAFDEAQAKYDQGKANEELAGVTAARWKNLASKGAVSRQENDQYQAQYQAQIANLQALDKSIASARSNISSANANLDRLVELQGYQIVKAPFDGVVTLRNIDVGTLITGGNTLLYRVAQTDVLRTYVNVPQTDADAIRVGQPAGLSVSNLPGRQFTGTVTRTSNSLDPVTRTLLVEVQVRNSGDVLLPRHVHLGQFGQFSRQSSSIDPRRHAHRSVRRAAGRTGASGSHRSLPKDQHRPGLWRSLGSAHRPH